MKIRLEIGHTRSQDLPWVLRLCRQIPTFTEKDEGEMKIYSVEFIEADLGAFEAILLKVSAWKQTAYYLNGKLTSGGEIMREILRRRYRKARLSKANAEDVINEL